MSELTREETRERLRRKILFAATRLFLNKGYHASTLREICSEAKVNLGSLTNIFGCKENILGELVKFVLERQFSRTAKLLDGVTNDKILFYAAETTLQLYITESNENIRELYSVAYSLPNTTEIIQQTITGKLENIFREHLPRLETKDFYMLEIASGGVMRGFMTVPCSMWFTIEEKVASFLRSTFLIYEVPKEKINEAIEFVRQFDFKHIAWDAVQSMIDSVGEKA